MTETHIYFTNPIDVHALRTVIEAFYPAHPGDFNVWDDGTVRVELEYRYDGFPLVERDVWSSEGPFLEEVACWGRLNISTHTSGTTEPADALGPLMQVGTRLSERGVEIRWHDPYSMNTNSGVDLFDVMHYHTAADWIRSQVDKLAQ